MSTTTHTTKIEESSILFTAMLGTVLWRRLDLSAGVINNDATASSAILLGPSGKEEMFTLRNEIYSHEHIDDRVTLTTRPWWKNRRLHALYLKAGLESFRKVSGTTPLFIGGGISFDDDDIKLLFALK